MYKKIDRKAFGIFNITNRIRNLGYQVVMSENMESLLLLREGDMICSHTLSEEGIVFKLSYIDEHKSYSTNHETLLFEKLCELLYE